MKNTCFRNNGKKLSHEINKPLMKRILVGLGWIILLFVIDLDCLAQQNEESKDVKSEIQVIKVVENAIGKILKNPKMKNKQAFKLLESALARFNKFQTKAGWKYIMGSPGDTFHKARNETGGINGLMYRKLSDNPQEEVSEETRNVLKLYKTYFEKDRKLLNVYLQRGY